MYTEKEDHEEPESRYTQIRIPLKDLEKYKQAGWQLVEEQNSIAVIRKELKK